MTDSQKTETATFGAGCFWGVEDLFRALPGVTDTAVGYMGGTTEKPTYEEVCRDDTGHAEVVQVTYDPALISYDTLLETFWANHNPTTKDRQGPDIGTQYRSVIFTHSPEQEAAAKGSLKKNEEAGRWNKPVVTQIVPTEPFWRAEEYHQLYLLKNGLSSCHI